MGGRFDNQVVLITGASRGIGRACALAFAREGARIAANYRADDAMAASLAAELNASGATCLLLKADISDEGQVAGMIARCLEHFGRLDVLVNNAGVGIGETVDELTTKKIDLQLATNLRSIFLFYREAMGMLRAAGGEHRNALVVNTASISGIRGEAWLSVYSATKHGVIGFTQAMNKELASAGIKNTALAPGFVDTPMTDFVKQHVPAEEMITPGDIAEAVRYLLRTSPGCVVPEIRFEQPGGGLTDGGDVPIP